jgi:hypothetical protein
MATESTEEHGKIGSIKNNNDQAAVGAVSASKDSLAREAHENTRKPAYADDKKGRST